MYRKLAVMALAVGMVACSDMDLPTQPAAPFQPPSAALTTDEARVGTYVKAGVNDITTAPLMAGSKALGADAGVGPVMASTHGSGLATQQLSASLTAAQLAQSLAGPGVVISNVTYAGVARAAGRFHGGTGIIGFESGIILSSGNINFVPGPNTSGSITANNGQPGDAGLTAIAGVATEDRAILQFDFVPNGDFVAFEYVFSSDEYNEYAPSSYNDPFAFYVNGVNCAQVGNTGDPVTINNVRLGKNAAFYRSNAPPTAITIDTEMDGLTVVLVCQAAVNAGVTNTLKLAIADANDALWDSNVFIKAGSFSTTVPGQISLSPLTATLPENPAATHTVQAQVRFANGAPQPGITVSFEVIAGPNAGATGSGVTNSFGQTTFTWTDVNGDGTDVVEATYVDPADTQTYSATAEMIWTSVNEAPVADAGGPYTGLEGSAVAFDGSGSSDADGDPLTYAWDFGDGNTGTGVNPSHTYADNGTYTVTLTVNDGEDDSTPVTTTAEIANVAPTVTMPAAATIDEGGTFAGSGSFADPGADAWSATVDYGDGSGVQPLSLSGNAFALSHGYADNGNYTITVVVTETDPENASGSGTAQLEVNNLAPVVSAGADVTLISGTGFTLAGSFSDAGVADAPWGWGVDFSGSMAAGSTADQIAPITPASHTYLIPGAYPVTLTVTDKDGGVGQDDLVVTVQALSVGIDIKPNSDPSSFGCSAKGSIPVAVLSSATFDATELDANTVRFGKTGVETGEVHMQGGLAKRHVEDVNGDTLEDMVFHFDFQLTGFGCADIPGGSKDVTLMGHLSGVTQSGVHVAATSDLRLVGRGN